MITSFSFAQQTKRKLVWEENFNKKEVNETFWNFELGDGCPNLCGYGNNERQIYTKTNHEFKDGNLVIEARKEGSKYTSTKITTKGKKEFKYGRIEARAKLPIGHGLWPAFWMLAAPFFGTAHIGNLMQLKNPILGLCQQSTFMLSASI